MRSPIEGTEYTSSCAIDISMYLKKSFVYAIQSTSEDENQPNETLVLLADHFYSTHVGREIGSGKSSVSRHSPQLVKNHTLELLY